MKLWNGKAIKKEITLKRMTIRRALKVIILEAYLVRKGKRTISMYFPPTDLVKEKDKRDLEQLQTFSMMLEDFL